MNLIELERALRQLRLGGMAAVLETRLRQAQAEPMAPIDLISCLVSDELTRRSDRLLERRRKQAGFRDPDRTLDNFDFTFNPKMNRSLVFDLATGAFIGKREDALFLGPGGTGKSHLAQAIGQAAIQQGYKVLYRETHVLLDELADAVRRRHAQRVHGIGRHGSAADHRRLRHAQAAAHRRRGSAGNHHAPLRAFQHAADFQPSRRGLGQTARRRRRRQRHARSPAASRPRAQVRPAQLAHQNRTAFVRKEACFTARALPSRSRDLSLSRQNAGPKGRAETAPQSRPLSRRSGRIPALPYPPPRCCQSTASSAVPQKKFAKRPLWRYKYSCPEPLLRWPVLRCPRMAGFQVSTEGPQKVNPFQRVPLISCASRLEPWVFLVSKSETRCQHADFDGLFPRGFTILPRERHTKLSV